LVASRRLWRFLCSRRGCATSGSSAIAVTALEAVALLGLLLAPGAAVLWVLLFAVGQGGAISLALMLMMLRAPDASRAAELSGMAQAIGYSLAALGPFLLGALYDSTGDWDAPLVALLALTAPLAAVGLAAGRARTVRAAGRSKLHRE
jgi:CP family cyanate transporter-like MFS transporter